MHQGEERRIADRPMIATRKIEKAPIRGIPSNGDGARSGATCRRGGKHTLQDEYDEASIAATGRRARISGSVPHGEESGKKAGRAGARPAQTAAA
jgi:hypothetical protein